MNLGAFGDDSDSDGDSENLKTVQTLLVIPVPSRLMVTEIHGDSRR
jgi:hypothetical protein